MIKRIGMLTSGGDCQAINATMRGVVKGLSNNLEELEVSPESLPRAEQFLELPDSRLN